MIKKSIYEKELFTQKIWQFPKYGKIDKTSK